METGLGIKDALIVETPIGESGIIPSFREQVFGAGSSIAKFNDDGFFMGATNFADAPFKVTYAGSVTATDLTLTGGTIKAGQTAYNTGTGYWLGTVSGTPKFSIGDGSTKYLTWDGTSLTIRGTLNADDLVAGTITGRTIRTAAPAAGVGSAVVITGGSNQEITLYYDATLKGTIKGYTTEGSEETYVSIVAASGRSIKLKNSRTEIDGSLQTHKVYPSADNTYELGDAAKRWSKGHFEDIDVDDIYVGVSFSGCGSIAGCAYLEVNLLNEEQKELYKKNAKDAEKNHEKVTEFEEGDVLSFGSKGLKKSDLDTCFCVAAVADKRGMPIVLGAEKIKVIGKVAINQYLVTCGVPGYARAWNTQVCGNPPIGTVIAQAMENKTTPGEGVIMAMIRKI